MFNYLNVSTDSFHLLILNGPVNNLVILMKSIFKERSSFETYNQDLNEF